MNVNISNLSLFASSILVLISLGISKKLKLKLEKDTIISVIRAVIQLIIIGYILIIIFKINNYILTFMMQLFIIFNAANNAKNRGKEIQDAFKISLISLLFSTFITMFILIITKALTLTPYQIIPVTGMVAGNSMKAVGLVYRSLKQQFKDQQSQINERLALGANLSLASGEIVIEAIRNGMQPTIDLVRTYGLVSLPGLMTGLIMTGVSPIKAIKYQIMVVFMLLSATGIAAVISSYMAYKKFYNKDWQLK